MVTPARQAKLATAAANKLPDVRIILEDIHDPHNAAAILRTAEGLGVGSVWYLFDTEEQYNPREIGKRSSATANQWVDIEVFTKRSAIEKRLREEGFTSYAAVLDEADSMSLWQKDFSDDVVALWFGNEFRGLSTAAEDFCDYSLTVPMQGMVESLNVSVAAAIMVAEITRQKRCLSK